MAADYKVLSGFSEDLLEQRVKDALAQGYVLHGGLQVAVIPRGVVFGKEELPRPVFYQAVVK